MEKLREIQPNLKDDSMKTKKGSIFDIGEDDQEYDRTLDPRKFAPPHKWSSLDIAEQYDSSSSSFLVKKKSNLPKFFVGKTPSPVNDNRQYNF